MKFNTKLIAATFAVAATLGSASAFASDDDGNKDNAWLQQTAISQQQAPAPVAAAGDAKDANLNTQAIQP